MLSAVGRKSNDNKFCYYYYHCSSDTANLWCHRRQPRRLLHRYRVISMRVKIMKRMNAVVCRKLLAAIRYSFWCRWSRILLMLMMLLMMMTSRTVFHWAWDDHGQTPAVVTSPTMYVIFSFFDLIRIWIWSCRVTYYAVIILQWQAEYMRKCCSVPFYLCGAEQSCHWQAIPCRNIVRPI